MKMSQLFTGESSLYHSNKSYYTGGSTFVAGGTQSITLAAECPAGTYCCSRTPWGTCTGCCPQTGCVPCSRHFATGFCVDYEKCIGGDERQTSGPYWCWWGSGAHNKQPCDTL
jgi:hypothetical protein